MVKSLLFYKNSSMHEASGVAKTWRYEINNLESIMVSLDQPVSPMALPQEDASENVLVKMEGNTQTVTVNWKVADSFPKPQQCNSLLLTSGISTDIEEYYAGSSSTASWSDAVSSDSAGRVVSWLLGQFQGKDISDRYFIKLGEDVDVMEGFITRINANISGNSPVVWDLSITFVMGNVISIYESDAPSEPRNVATATVNATGGASGTKTRMMVSWSVPSDSSSTVTGYGIWIKDGESSYGGEPDFTVSVYQAAASPTNTNTAARDAELAGHVTGGSNYEVSWGDPNADNTAFLNVDSGSYTDAEWSKVKGKSLASGKEYFIKVAAKNIGGGYGLKSNEVAITMP